MAQYASGQQISTSLAGTELVGIDNGGAVLVAVTAQRIANLAGISGGATITAALIGTESVAVAAGTTPYTTSVSVIQRFQGSFTTASMSNSTSITLSETFTALVLTQTSTGNTVMLKAAPSNEETQGFSINANVTNLTVSSAANTVSNGAATNTTSAGASIWYIFNSANTSWYRYNGMCLSQ